MDVAVGGLELGMAEAGGDVLDVRAVAQEQGRGGMPQGVELAVREAMPIKEAAEPQCRGGRVHRFAVSLDKQPLVTLPSITDQQARLILLGAVTLQHLQAVGREHDAADAAGLGGLAADLGVAGDLVIAAADGQHAGIEVDVRPFQPDQFPTTAAGVQRHMDQHLEHQRLAFERLHHLVDLAVREDLGDRFVLFRQGDAVAVGGILADQPELVGGVHQRADHRVVAPDRGVRELLRLTVEPCVAGDQIVDEVLDVDGADVLELHVAEHRDDAEVEHVGVLFVDDRREGLLGGFHVHRYEVGELEAAVGGDLALLAEVLEEDSLTLHFLLDLLFGHPLVRGVGHGAADLLAVDVIAAGHHDEVTIVSFTYGCHER